MPEVVEDLDGSDGVEVGYMKCWDFLSNLANQTKSESRPCQIGLMTDEKKLAGAPCAGNPLAGCDVAGAGNRLNKYCASARPYVRGRAGEVRARHPAQ